ncbi:MAG: diguanylate cyclase, partial [Singulisphaera sp.]
MSISAQQKLRVIWERFFPMERWRDPEALRQAGRVVAFDLTMFFWVLIFAPIYALLGSGASVVILLIIGVILPAALVLLQRGISPTLCGNILCFGGWLTYTALIFVQGGMSGPSPTLTWFASLPVCAVYMCGLRSGIFWTAASIVAVTGFAVADHLGYYCPNTLTPFAMRLQHFLALAGLIVCMYFLVHVLTRFELNVRRTLHEANCRLEAQSSLDSLTGIANRRSFDWTLEREWKRHERAGMPISVALIDV